MDLRVKLCISLIHQLVGSKSVVKAFTDTENKGSILEREPEKRLPLPRLAAGAKTTQMAAPLRWQRRLVWGSLRALP